MSKVFNSLEEIQKYYNKEINTYIFKENNQFIDLVVFNFDLNINANIRAFDIKAHNISAWDITAYDINVRDISAWDINANDISAFDIKARDISAYDISAFDINANNINAHDINADSIRYYAVCFAYNNIKCKYIKSRRVNAKHFVLDGVLEVEE